MADFKQVTLKNGQTILVKDEVARNAIANMTMTTADSIDPSVSLKIGNKTVSFRFEGDSTNGIMVSSEGDGVIDINASALKSACLKYTDDKLAAFLKAYIDDNDTSDSTIDTLVEIAQWIADDEAGAAKALADIAALQSKVGTIESQVGVNKSDIATLKSNYNTVIAQYDSLGSTVSNHTSLINQHDAKIQAHDSAIAALVATYDSSTETLTLPV